MAINKKTKKKNKIEKQKKKKKKIKQKIHVVVKDLVYLNIVEIAGNSFA